MNVIAITSSDDYIIYINQNEDSMFRCELDQTMTFGGLFS